MSALLQILNARAPDLLRTLGLMELQITILALLVLAVEHALRAPLPKVRYALWLVVLAKCLLPPLLKMPQSDFIPAGFDKLFHILPAVASTGSTSNPQLSLAAIILLLWLAASLSLAVVALQRFVSLRARLRESQPFALPAAMANHFSWPSIWRSEQLSTPIAIGLFRPRIYLNSAALASGDSALQAVLYHELAHVLRRDGWIVLVQTLAQILHPFNPFVWLTNIRLFRRREQICDDFALRHTAIEPQRYGEMLLRFLEMKSFAPLATQSAAGFFETKNGCQQRLKYLLSPKAVDMSRFTWKHKLLLAGLALALVPASWQCGRQLNSPAAPTISITPAQINLTPEQQAIALTPTDTKLLQRLEKELQELSAQMTKADTKVRSNPYFEYHSQQESRLLEELRQAIAKTLQRGRVALSPEGAAVVASETAYVESNPPEPVGGLLAIQQHLIYPAAARSAKIEGVVFLQILVLENGEIGEVKVLKTPAADMGLEEAAVIAVKSVKWKPAFARGRPIKTWIGLPVQFSLTE